MLEDLEMNKLLNLLMKISIRSRNLVKSQVSQLRFLILWLQVSMVINSSKKDLLLPCLVEFQRILEENIKLEETSTCFFLETQELPSPNSSNMWSKFSQEWFTLLVKEQVPSVLPLVFTETQSLKSGFLKQEHLYSLIKVCASSMSSIR